MKTHISRIVRMCFYHLRHLCTVCRRLGQEITARLVSGLFVVTGLLQCSSGGLSPRDHVTSALRSLHWLPVKQRIEFKLCLLVHQTINVRASAYLKDLIETSATVPGLALNRSAGNSDLATRRMRLKLGERAFSCHCTTYRELVANRK